MLLLAIKLNVVRTDIPNASGCDNRSRLRIDVRLIYSAIDHPSFSYENRLSAGIRENIQISMIQ
jgi:hypothetical protein